MKTERVPSWSFLAIEPIVRSVLRRKPALTTTFLRCPSSSVRAQVFWELYGFIEREVAKSNPAAILDRRKLAVRAYYAMVDLTELSDASDREIQRRLASIGKVYSAAIPSIAATQPVSTSSVA